MSGPAVELAFLVLNPITVGLVAYRTGKRWPTGLCLTLLLIYTVLAVPLVLNAAPPAYCHGQLDCPDPDTRAFTFALGFVWLIADCIAAFVGRIYGSNAATGELGSACLFFGRGRLPLPPRR